MHFLDRFESFLIVSLKCCNDDLIPAFATWRLLIRTAQLRVRVCNEAAAAAAGTLYRYRLILQKQHLAHS